ncbi:MAG: hypothetical protein KatS3mg057_0531 [Herpetosiphonaceae bacterium]|nr:MAG: hypothetical protein KatS3mg057_0531 [Herpetosiphonaceae bacterium]
MIDNTSPNTYDELPYHGISYTLSHPDRLATIAALAGINAPPVASCRVLELGCASGNNLIPMAAGLPHSTFVGIDFSQRQIAEGQAIIEELGLGNITLKHLDIREIDETFGQFDYIIAHGVYSWVPPDVRDHLLAVCKRNLTPNGVAFVSYNTYPGWHLSGMLRDILLYHTRNTSDPEQRVTESMALLRLLADTGSPKRTLFGNVVSECADLFHEYLDAAHSQGRHVMLAYDLLARVNEPVYFSQFMDHASRHGLQYLADAEFQSMFFWDAPEHVKHAVRTMTTSTVELEQYLDFFYGRTFRRTLLCHADRVVDRRLKWETLRSMCMRSRAISTDAQSELHSTTAVEFRGPNTGATFSVEHPITKAALIVLAERWPEAVPFEALLDEARGRLNRSEQHLFADQQQEAVYLGANLLKAHCYSRDLVDLHTISPPIVTTASNYPVVSAVARIQARQGNELTNLYHELVNVDPTSRRLIQHCDGTHDRTALIDAMLELSTALAVAPEEDREAQAPLDRDAAAQAVDRMVESLIRSALLVK